MALCALLSVAESLLFPFWSYKLQILFNIKIPYIKVGTQAEGI